MTSYDADRFVWSEEQGRALRRHVTTIDAARIAGIIEQLGQDDIATIGERIRILLGGLLRWAYQVDLRSVALHSTIFVQRLEIAQLIEESPSLLSCAEDMVIEQYPAARRMASFESGPFGDSFPVGLPFLPSEVLDEKFLPDPYGDDSIRGPGWWRNR